MLTARRLVVYTHTNRADRLTPRQRRRATHKANRLDPKARAVALAAIAAVVAGCSGGGHAKTALTAQAGPPSALAVPDRRLVPAVTTTTVAPAPSPAERSEPPAHRPVAPRRGPVAGGGCSLDYIRAHENGGDYGRSTNPTHFGAFQFDRQTWAANGGDPSHWGTASPAEQEAVAATTYARRGSQPWQVCG